MKRDSRTLVSKAPDLADDLRVARPSLLLRVKQHSDNRFECTPCISDIEDDYVEVIDEGYDPHHSPLGCPVHWRVVNRGDEQFYCSTFLATRAQVIKGWGLKGLVYCDRVTGVAVARIETRLPK